MNRYTGVLAAVALLAVGVVVSGCGESAKARSLATNSPVTKDEATAYAHEVNLGPADVAGMVSVSLEGEEKEKTSNLESACDVRESHLHIVNIHSPYFRSGEGLQLKEVRSQVEVMPTVALANSKFAQIQADVQNPRARSCLERRLSQSFAKGLTRGVGGRARVTFGRTTLSVLHFTIPHSFGLRLVFPFTVTGTTRSIRGSFDVDESAFLDGPAAIGLTSFGFSGPVPTEQQLLSRLYSRANA